MDRWDLWVLVVSEGLHGHFMEFGCICTWWYLASLVFSKNCRKIGVNTSRPEIIKWWHHQCVSHEVMTSPMSVQSESSICWGAFPRSWIFIKNPLVTSSIFVFISFHLDCFSQPLQIQRLAKYDPWFYLLLTCNGHSLLFKINKMGASARFASRWISIHTDRCKLFGALCIVLCIYFIVKKNLGFRHN